MISWYVDVGCRLVALLLNLSLTQIVDRNSARLGLANEIAVGIAGAGRAIPHVSPAIARRKRRTPLAARGWRPLPAGSNPFAARLPRICGRVRVQYVATIQYIGLAAFLAFEIQIEHGARECH